MMKKSSLFLLGIMLIYHQTNTSTLDKIHSSKVKEGIVYSKIMYTNDSHKSTSLHVMEIEPSKYKLDLYSAQNQRDTVSDIAKSHDAFLAINGSNYRRGGPYNGCRLNLIQSSEVCCCTGSFYAGSLLIDDKNNLFFDFCKADPIVRIKTQTAIREIKLDGVNIPHIGFQTILYDASFKMKYLSLENDTLILKKTKNKISCGLKKGKVKIPTYGFVVIVDKNMLFDAAEIKDITLDMRLTCKLHHDINSKTVIAGAGMLLKDKEVCDLSQEFSMYCPNPQYGDEAAANFNDLNQRRILIDDHHPRTAIAETTAGKIIILVADGRLETSVGLSLPELQQILLQLGCTNALNLGGGGCSTLVLDDKVINAPSQTRERPVSEALCWGPY